MKREPYSYRDDPSVPAWDDTHGLIVYDGECVLCSHFVRFVFEHDREAYFRFTSAQGALGQALYRHYALDATDFETNLVIANGRLYEKLYAFAEITRLLGRQWRLLSGFALFRAR